MKFVFIDVPNPKRGLGVAYNGPMLQACIHACRGNVVNIEVWHAEQEQRLAAGEVPVFLLVNHPLQVECMKLMRLNRNGNFIIIDHPHASEMRIDAKSEDWASQASRMVRLSVNGIYAPYREGAPILWDRKFPWDIQPWRTNLPRSLLYCPSAPDLYGKDWLCRDDSLESEFMAMVADMKRRGLLAEDVEVILRKRFENAWAAQHQDRPPGAREAILASGGTVDGNSAVHFDALRLGTPAFIWRHPGKPLANTLAMYAPLTLNLYGFPAIYRVDREPLFAQLAMSQLTLEELAEHPSMFERLVNYQLDHLGAGEHP
jgi:hypothetical protein